MAEFGDTQARLETLRTLLEPMPESAVPLLLFPVSLETRFVNDDGADELLVRIRPDDLTVDMHEARLTQREVTWGHRYWEQVWRAGEDESRRLAAWQEFARLFGAPRAAWVARQLAPINLATDRPTEPIAADAPLPIAPQFPEPSLKESAWSQQALLRAQPQRWVVVGYRQQKRLFIVWGEPVVEGLAVTPAPVDVAAPSTPISEEALALDETLRWLVDFSEAERSGLGVRVPRPAGS